MVFSRNGQQQVVEKGYNARHVGLQEPEHDIGSAGDDIISV